LAEQVIGFADQRIAGSVFVGGPLAKESSP
jgi:hypothetical protein